MILISQDGLKAIDASKIDFYYITTNKNNGEKHLLMAKAPKFPAEEGYYDFLILFEHKDIDVVKAVMEFLVAFRFLCPDEFILHVDLDTIRDYTVKIAPEFGGEESGEKNNRRRPS